MSELADYEIYLVRDGDATGGRLSDPGMEQAKKALQFLVEQGLYKAATVLTSPIYQARQTAEFIRTGLGSRQIIESLWLQKAGLDPSTYDIRSFATILEHALREADETQLFFWGERVKGVVAVTHGPLVSALKDIQDPAGPTVVGGEVLKYERPKQPAEPA